MTDDLHTLPRLYINAPLRERGSAPLNEDQAHYLRNVLRKTVSNSLRVFNGQSGEFLADITALDKKKGSITITQKIKIQPPEKPRIHLYFAPIKKQRLDFLIEKAVEIGASDLHPVIANRTENRHIKLEKIETHIIEAAEQCERLSIPVLHPALSLPQCLSKLDHPLYAALERQDAPSLKNLQITGESGFLIGPEGGFNSDEIALILQNPNITPISLGKNILRAETAALVCLALATQ